MNNIKLSQAKAMKQLYALTTKRTIDLSLSENPLGCSPLVLAASKNLKVNFNDYPLANGHLLKKALAKHFTLSENNFFIANGSEAVINYLPKVFGRVGDEVLVPALSFPLFAISTKLASKKLVRVKMTSNLGIDLAAMRKTISAKTCLIFLCNPNNPTGAVLPKQAILDFFNCVPKNVLLVVDEANIEFAGESVISEIKSRDNLLVLRTFSKGFGLAGLRVGFATANNRLIEKLEEETPPFPISSISEQLAGVALKDQQFLERTREFVAKELGFLEKSLKTLGFQVFPSQANNLFVKIPDRLNDQQFKKSLQKIDISVVMGSSFVGFNDSFFRISVRTHDINLRFIQKISSSSYGSKLKEPR